MDDMYERCNDQQELQTTIITFLCKPSNNVFWNLPCKEVYMYERVFLAGPQCTYAVHRNPTYLYQTC